jgi:hypothetical protein
LRSVSNCCGLLRPPETVALRCALLRSAANRLLNENSSARPAQAVYGRPGAFATSHHPSASEGQPRSKRCHSCRARHHSANALRTRWAGMRECGGAANSAPVRLAAKHGAIEICVIWLSGALGGRDERDEPASGEFQALTTVARPVATGNSYSNNPTRRTRSPNRGSLRIGSR